MAQAFLRLALVLILHQASYQASVTHAVGIHLRALCCDTSPPVHVCSNLRLTDRQGASLNTNGPTWRCAQADGQDADSKASAESSRADAAERDAADARVELQMVEKQRKALQEVMATERKAHAAALGEQVLPSLPTHGPMRAHIMCISQYRAWRLTMHAKSQTGSPAVINGNTTHRSQGCRMSNDHVLAA